MCVVWRGCVVWWGDEEKMGGGGEQTILPLQLFFLLFSPLLSFFPFFPFSLFSLVAQPIASTVLCCS